MDTNTVQVINNISDKLNDYITTVATKLGQTSEHFWPIFVKQQRLDGIWTFSLMTVAAIILIVLARKAWKSVSKSTDDDIQGMGFTFLTLGIVAFVVVYCAVCGNAFTSIVNPEYAAFNQIIKTIK